MSTDNLPSPTSGTEALLAKLDQLPALSVDDVVERTLTATLNATTVDQVFKNPQAMGLRDLVGETLLLVAISGWLPSDIKTGLGRYVVLDCVLVRTGEHITCTTGSPYVITAAVRAMELGALPVKVKVVELESRSNPSQGSLWLVSAPAAQTPAPGTANDGTE